jgi:hypothetical protein
MKRLLKFAGLFLLPLILALLVFETCLRSIPTSYTEKEKGWNNGGFEVLILGNSHAAYGINPDQFARPAFNGANVAQSLYFDKRITLKHLDGLKKLRFVLIGIDYHSLYFSSQGARDALSYLGHGVAYKNAMSFFEKRSYLCAYQAKMGFNFIRRKASGKYDKIRAVDVENGVDLGRPIFKGWFGYVGTQKLDAASCSARVAGFREIVGSSEFPTVAADLEDFIVQLKDRGITPILVSTPCYKGFNSLLDPAVLRRNALYLSELQLKYGLHYWNDARLPLPDHDFYNCDHLNRDGAAAYSKMLNARLEREFPHRQP